MRTAILIFLTLLAPIMAVSEEITVGSDRFAECNDSRSDPNKVHECYFAVGDEVEREMVRSYRLAQTALRAFDAEYSTEKERSMTDLLQETQIAFENYRKLHCKFPEREALGGTGSINSTIACRVELTLFRIEQLMEQSSIR